MPTKQNADFEGSLKELETVVRQLEAGDVTLAEMLSLFEKGVVLTKTCTELLDNAEQKISVLMKNANGEVEPRPFEGTQ